tara:strand:+ start:95 stop:670 length:576 start_codon:yes stop_codon:yes gene_type:complete
MEVLYLILFAYVAYMLIVSIGITYGYHRYFSHKEFKATNWQEVIMLYCGLLCGGRSPLTWVGVHRMHHAHSDTELDPHSKKFQPWYVILFSLWHVDSIPRKFIKDMLKNPRVVFFHKHRNKLYIANAILLTLIFGPKALLVLGIIYLLAYFGFGALNLWGHDAEGPINNIWINLIAPWEGNHKDHHEVSTR